MMATPPHDEDRYVPVNIDEESSSSGGGVGGASAPLAPAVGALPFFALGLLNNASYIIMLASAKSISEGGTALVYLACVLPSLSLKASAPYWFDKVEYHTRLTVAAGIMAVAFCWVAVFSYTTTSVDSNNESTDPNDTSTSGLSVKTVGQLLGVSIMSLQTGLGEASLLALAGKLDRMSYQRSVLALGPRSEHSKMTKGRLLTAFSSGTGLSGPFGYLWKILFTQWMKLSLRVTLLLGAATLATTYGAIYRRCLGHVHLPDPHKPDEHTAIIQRHTAEEIVSLETTDEASNSNIMVDGRQVAILDGPTDSLPISHMSRSQRFQLVLTLWPYTIPLFTVYAAEYACQAGAWTAIGFPLDNVEARTTFYLTSNWLYQLGVFVSRSSGTLINVSLPVLWLMPVLQVVNLIFFAATAVHPTSIWYNSTLYYVVAFYTGLLGGGVYVHGYQRIVADMPSVHTEFALAATSVAESFGILMADVSGLFLQACIYQANGLDGALLQCPWNRHSR